jgi:hypothetical protein
VAGSGTLLVNEEFDSEALAAFTLSPSKRPRRLNVNEPPDEKFVEL